MIPDSDTRFQGLNLQAVSATPVVVTIANGDTTTLRTTVDSACRGGLPVIVNLAANGTYTFTSGPYNLFYPTALLICGNVTIIGNGATLERDTNGINPPLYRLIGVDGNGTLNLQNVTLQNGKIDGNGGAALLVIGGTAILHDVTILNNDATDPDLNSGFLSSGSAVYNYFGTLELNRVTISQSDSVANLGGGAINSWGGSFIMRNSDIFNNTSYQNGGGVFVRTPSLMELEYNEIYNNTAPNAGALEFDGSPSQNTFANFNCIYNNSSVAVNATQSPQLDAELNWWNGSPSTGSNVDADPAVQTQPTDCNSQTAWQQVLPTPTPTPTFTPTPAPTLASYGISLISDGQAWVAAEETNILNGANRVSDALSLFNTAGATPSDRFKTVMGTNITFLRLASNQPQGTSYGVYYKTPDGFCEVWDPTDVISTIVVACRGFMLQTNSWITNGLVTEYAVVHELGHVLDIRSGTDLRGYVGNTSRFFLADCSGSRVMGVSSGASWARGQRGWGSSDPDTGSGQEISQFQQNPYDQMSDVEAAADMFLNWVYRRTTDAAPTGITSNFDPLTADSPAPQAACNYPDSGTWIGFRNIDRFGMLQATEKPGNVRYWWMEGTLERIFRDEGWK